MNAHVAYELLFYFDFWMVIGSTFEAIITYNIVAGVTSSTIIISATVVTFITSVFAFSDAMSFNDNKAKKRGIAVKLCAGLTTLIFFQIAVPLDFQPTYSKQSFFGGYIVFTTTLLSSSISVLLAYVMKNSYNALYHPDECVILSRELSSQKVCAEVVEYLELAQGVREAGLLSEEVVEYLELAQGVREAGLLSEEGRSDEEEADAAADAARNC